MRAFAFVIACFFLAAPAAATQPTGNSSGSGQAIPTTPSNANTEAEEDPDRRVCRRIETNTGSRVPHRLVCMTVREWRAFNRQND